jgi:hypothetical protein
VQRKGGTAVFIKTAARKQGVSPADRPDTAGRFGHSIYKGRDPDCINSPEAETAAMTVVAFAAEGQD